MCVNLDVSDFAVTEVSSPQRCSTIDHFLRMSVHRVNLHTPFMRPQRPIDKHRCRRQLNRGQSLLLPNPSVRPLLSPLLITKLPCWAPQCVFDPMGCQLDPSRNPKFHAAKHPVLPGAKLSPPGAVSTLHECAAISAGIDAPVSRPVLADGANAPRKVAAPDDNVHVPEPFPRHRWEWMQSLLNSKNCLLSLKKSRSDFPQTMGKSDRSDFPFFLVVF